MAKPSVVATLIWEGDLRFSAADGTNTMMLDGDGKAGTSPVQTLAFSIAGCMAMDVVAILRKGRHLVSSIEVQFAGDRAEMHPRRLTSVYLKFVLRADIPPAAIERAIELSRQKYCSVSNSLRSDIEFVTSFEVRP